MRREYQGAAFASVLTQNLGASAEDLTIYCNDLTNWPTGNVGPFYVVIDPGTSVEEKCLATISGSTLTLTRGQDDTTAANHSSGATIYPVFTANDADEANELVSKLTTKGDLLVTTGSALNRLAVGTNDQVLVADSAATNGVKWGTVSTTGLASDAVTTAKILDANVTEAKLASGAVTAAKIGTDAVTTVKIQDNAVTQAKLADRTVGSAELDNLTFNAQTGTTYTLVLADAHKVVTLNNSSAITLTVPPNSSVAFETGDQVNLLQLGAGQVTVAAGSGVTLRAQGTRVKLNGQYALATLVKIGTDEWVLVGNTVA